LQLFNVIFKPFNVALQSFNVISKPFNAALHPFNVTLHPLGMAVKGRSVIATRLLRASNWNSSARIFSRAAGGPIQ
jgi:hypothetical protein